jgi:hypothetical protein
MPFGPQPMPHRPIGVSKVVKPRMLSDETVMSRG